MLDDRADVGLTDGVVAGAVSEGEPNALGCGSRWGVCHTHPQAERWALANLQRQGYLAYLPLVTVRKRDAVVQGLWHDVELPLFGRYLFVVVGTHWSPIRHTLGVSRLLMSGENPHHVRAGVVEALQEGEALRRYPPSSPTSSWAPGMACRALVGGVEVRGAVTRVGKGKISIASVMFGEVREISVDINGLRPV